MASQHTQYSSGGAVQGRQSIVGGVVERVSGLAGREQTKRTERAGGVRTGLDWTKQVKTGQDGSLYLSSSAV